MATTAGITQEVASPRKVVVVGIDESDHSHYALEWILDHLFASATAAVPAFRLVIVYAKPSAASVIIDLGSAEFMQSVEADLRKVAAAWVVDGAKKLCLSKSLQVGNVLIEAVEGDARSVLCKAVEKHNTADLLVIGSHGYGAFKRALLGSVSDYRIHQVPSSVMIVKKFSN